MLQEHLSKGNLVSSPEPKRDWSNRVISQLRAGFGRRDITPSTGAELGGYGAFLRRRCDAVEAPIYANAMAVQHIDQCWIVVSADLLAVEATLSEKARRRVSEHTGVPIENIVVHATHTHSGPAVVTSFTGWGMIDPWYNARLPDLLADAAIAAFNELAPAIVRFGAVAVNGFAYDRMKLGYDPKKPEVQGHLQTQGDTTTAPGPAHVLSFWRGPDLAGFLCHFACHPVVCGEQSTRLHGDYPATAIDLVERANPNAIGVFVQGAMGDLNPAFAHGPLDASLRALKALGQQLADAITSGINSGLELPSSELLVATRTVDDPSPGMSQARVEHILNHNQKLLAAAAPSSKEQADLRAGAMAIATDRLLSRWRKTGEDRPMLSITKCGVGPISFLFCDAEIFHAYQIVVDRLGPNTNLIVSCANGYGGYLADERAFRSEADGYTTMTVSLLLSRIPFSNKMPAEFSNAILELAGS